MGRATHQRTTATGNRVAGDSVHYAEDDGRTGGCVVWDRDIELPEAGETRREAVVQNGELAIAQKYIGKVGADRERLGGRGGAVVYRGRDRTLAGGVDVEDLAGVGRKVRRVDPPILVGDGEDAGGAGNHGDGIARYYLSADAHLGQHLSGGWVAGTWKLTCVLET